MAPKLRIPRFILKFIKGFVPQLNGFPLTFIFIFLWPPTFVLRHRRIYSEPHKLSVPPIFTLHSVNPAFGGVYARTENQPETPELDLREILGDKDYTDLIKYWPSLTAKSHSVFHNTQWKDHGSQSGMEPKDFFKMVIHVAKHCNIAYALAMNKIYKDGSYHHSDFVAALESYLGGAKPFIRCHFEHKQSQQFLYEIFIGFNSDLEPYSILGDLHIANSAARTLQSGTPPASTPHTEEMKKETGGARIAKQALNHLKKGDLDGDSRTIKRERKLQEPDAIPSTNLKTEKNNVKRTNVAFGRRLQYQGAPATANPSKLLRSANSEPEPYSFPETLQTCNSPAQTLQSGIPPASTPHSKNMKKETGGAIIFKQALNHLKKGDLHGDSRTIKRERKLREPAAIPSTNLKTEKNKEKSTNVAFGRGLQNQSAPATANPSKRLRPVIVSPSVGGTQILPSSRTSVTGYDKLANDGDKRKLVSTNKTNVAAASGSALKYQTTTAPTVGENQMPPSTGFPHQSQKPHAFRSKHQLKTEENHRKTITHKGKVLRKHAKPEIPSISAAETTPALSSNHRIRPKLIHLGRNLNYETNSASTTLIKGSFAEAGGTSEQISTKNTTATSAFGSNPPENTSATTTPSKRSFAEAGSTSEQLSTNKTTASTFGSNYQTAYDTSTPTKRLKSVIIFPHAGETQMLPPTASPNPAQTPPFRSTQRLKTEDNHGNKARHKEMVPETHTRPKTASISDSETAPTPGPTDRMRSKGTHVKRSTTFAESGATRKREQVSTTTDLAAVEGNPQLYQTGSATTTPSKWLRSAIVSPSVGETVILPSTATSDSPHHSHTQTTRSPGQAPTKTVAKSLEPTATPPPPPPPPPPVYVNLSQPIIYESMERIATRM